MAGDFRTLFIDSKEQFICSLGSTYAQTFFSTGILGNGFAILTDKRVYFKGKCFARNGRRFVRRFEERTVDVGDITGTGFIHQKPVGAFIIGLLFFVFGVAAYYLMGVAGRLIALPFLALSLICFVISISKKSLFEIQFAGGGIAFDTHWFDETESQEFQKNIRIAKDNREMARQINQQNHNVPQQYGNIADELKKYNELLSAGAITQEEYDNVKMELLKKV